MSFVAQLAKSRGGSAVWQVVAPAANGEPAWWFVQVDPLKTRLFEVDVMAGPVHFPDYGTILASGWGDAPPEDVLRDMRERHGFEPA